MAYAALLAFHALGAGPEEQRLKDWILGFEDASGRFSKEEIAIVAERYRYDASIPGWSWIPRTTAWVEPTALFILALRRAGVPATEKRIRSGVELILDRRVRSGGWNFGNPYSKSYELEASTMSTALALAALGAAGLPESRSAVGAGLRFLKNMLGRDVSTASLAWALLALKSFPAGASSVAGVADRLSRLQANDGGFRGNPFETSLAYLVLSDCPRPRLPSGSRPMSRRGVSRREFMRLAGTSALSAWPAAALAGGLPQAAQKTSSGPLLQVALVPCPDYGRETLAAALRTGWRSSRTPDVRGKRVVVKPNMVDVSPDRPIHTDPRLIEALVAHLADLGAREIVLAEGTSHNRDAEDLFRRAGYEALARRRGSVSSISITTTSRP